MLTELHDLRFFKDLTPTQLEKLSEHAFLKEYDTGEVIIDYETKERFIGYMLKGACEMSFEAQDGTLHSMTTYKNAPVGAIFLDGFNAMNVLTANQPTKIIAWPLTALENLESEHPKLAMTFYKGVNFYLIQYFRRFLGTL